MRFLRSAILAIGLMSFAVACGGNAKGAAEPDPCANVCGGDACGDPCGGDACGDPCGGGW